MKNIFLIISLIIILLVTLIKPLYFFFKEGTTIRVVMYPYVPNGKKLFSVLKDKFETDHPLVNIQLVETFQESGSGLSELLASNYYDGGLLQSQADIYEIDTILLQSMIKANKIDPIQIPNSNYISQALKAVQYKNRNWGIPHWVCGNFLFYKKGDRAIAKASNLDELINTLKKEGFLLP